MPTSIELSPSHVAATDAAVIAIGFSPGSITAALSCSTSRERRQGHLDIASVGDSAKDALEYTEGATGFGARLLLRWIQGVAAA